MADYADAGHRPHGVHKGENPTTRISYGPDDIKVTLNTWGPQENLFSTLYNQLMANWGDQPSHVEGDINLTEEQMQYVESCFAGKTLQQALELITFAFTIDGVSRACTHQLVRTRIGCAVMQHGGRDNDWRHRRWTMPETIRRACVRVPGGEDNVSPEERPYETCVDNLEPIHNYIAASGNVTLMGAIEKHINAGKNLYASLVDAGIPWQDARRLLPIGTQTYIHISYTYPALRGVLSNRLEHVMDWEINCVAQLMLREIKMRCPNILSRYLGSHSDRAKRAVFSQLESWPPDMKWPSDKNEDDTKRTHRRHQNPFWILDPESMEGKGLVRWIKTNGYYPKNLRPKK
jgi:thymidylate synthase (FAD)